MFPADDQFEEHKIESVKKSGNGWEIQFDGGLGFGVPADSPIEPKLGMVARFYGHGFGRPVRGLFLDNRKVFYRTEAEDEEHREIELYGASANEWLRRWDEGRIVWSIEMGGLGPGYEQCIHITCAEILRVMLDKKYDCSKWSNEDKWKRDREDIEKLIFKNPIVEKLGISGAQWGAALNLAAQLYTNGPRKVMADELTKDRHIQVQKSFPVAA